MDKKPLILSLAIILLSGILIYGYVGYSNVSKDFDNLNTKHDMLKKELDSFTDVGTSKIKLPIDSDEKAVLVAANSKDYKDYYARVYEKQEYSIYLAYWAIFMPKHVLDSGRENYEWLPNEVDSLYIVKIADASEFKSDVPVAYNVYIDPKTGSILNSELGPLYERLVR